MDWAKPFGSFDVPCQKGSDGTLELGFDRGCEGQRASSKILIGQCEPLLSSLWRLFRGGHSQRRAAAFAVGQGVPGIP
jgi:hypothetical protein